MSDPNTSNVAASKPIGGGIFRATLGTALPTDATTALSGAFEGLGFVTDQGVVPNRETTTEKPKAWGGRTLAQLLTGESRGFSFTLLEVFQQAVQEFVHGAGNVVVTPAAVGQNSTISITDKGGKPEQCVLVFEMKHEGKRRRVIVPIADSVVDSEEAYADGNLNAYGITTEAIEDDTGVRVYEYLEGDDALDA